MDALCSDHDFSAALYPCEVFDVAFEHEGGHAPTPSEWTPGLVPPGAQSTFAEVSPAALIDCTLGSDVEWVYRFSATAIPKKTKGLARISVLLRGCEDTGIRTLVHSVMLAVSEKDGPPCVIDVAAYPPRANDARVLEFLLFSLERPLLYGSSLANLSVHVHFTEPPPFAKDQIKIALDAIYSPTLGSATSAWMTLSRGGGPQQLDALSLLLDGATGTLRIEGTPCRTAHEKWLQCITPLKSVSLRSSPSLSDEDFFDEAILSLGDGSLGGDNATMPFWKSSSKLPRSGRHGWPSESYVIPLEKTLHALELGGVDTRQPRQDSAVPTVKRPRQSPDYDAMPLWQRELHKQMPGLPLHYSQRNEGEEA